MFLPILLQVCGHLSAPPRAARDLCFRQTHPVSGLCTGTPTGGGGGLSGKRRWLWKWNAGTHSLIELGKGDAAIVIQIKRAKTFLRLKKRDGHRFHVSTSTKPASTSAAPNWQEEWRCNQSQSHAPAAGPAQCIGSHAPTLFPTTLLLYHQYQTMVYILVSVISVGCCGPSTPLPTSNIAGDVWRLKQG